MSCGLAKGAYDVGIGLLAASIEALDAEGHDVGSNSTRIHYEVDSIDGRAKR